MQIEREQKFHDIALDPNWHIFTSNITIRNVNILLLYDYRIKEPVDEVVI